MSTYVYGIKPPDATFNAMLAVHKACEKAKVQPPDDVIDFFNDTEPDPAGVLVNLEEVKGATKPWCDDMQEGIEIDLSKLPKGVTKIRFVNSW